MAFPATAVLDTFDRTNATTLGSNWSNETGAAQDGGITGNLAYNPDAASYNMYWNPQVFGPDCEAYITISAKIGVSDSDGHQVSCRLKEVGAAGTRDRYSAYVYVDTGSNDDFTMNRMDNGVATQLGAIVEYTNIANGDSIGIQAEGSTLRMYHKTSAGVWTLVLSRTDTTYPLAGYIGTYFPQDGTLRYNDFGGGTIPEVEAFTLATQPIPTCILPEPILRVITNDGKIVDLLEDWELADPYWRPQIAKYKQDGNYVDSSLADGKRLVFKKYDNVIETIPLVAKGPNEAQAIAKIRGLLQVNRQSSDYWTEPFEYDYAWLEVKPAGSDCRTGYARIIKANVPELNSPYTQPFFSPYSEATMDDLTLIIEREPLWRGVQPGTLIGPLFNLIKNSDFELWNFGITDSQPDNWTDLKSPTSITGSNNRESTDSHSGSYCLKVRVPGSTAANRAKGVSQTIASTRANTTYTVIAWVRNDGVTNGVGRILVTYSSQLEIYRSSTKHGWTLYTGTFTTGASDTVAISLEILTTAANTDGTVYFDSLMLLEGDWEQEAIDGVLPYMTSSHIVNHWDQVDSTVVEAGDLNYVDMWNVPGDESALVKLEMVNNTPDSNTNTPVVFQTIRAGMRRARDVSQFTNFYDPPGVADTTASEDDRINSGLLSTLWTTVGFFTIDDADLIQHNLGRFRVLARVWDASTSGAFNLEVRLRYWIGQANTSIKTLESVTVPNRGSWYIMDLTGIEALNWDAKGKNLPGSLGLEIQMRRASGTDQGRLDYVIILPTDGGVLFATVSPSVPLNSGLVVDNTNSSDVYGARLTRGWRQPYDSTSPGIGYGIGVRQNQLVDFNGTLYIGTEGEFLHRFNNNGGAFLYGYNPSPTTDVNVLEVFNNKLYILSFTNGYSSSGTSFPGTIDFTIPDANFGPLAAKAFRDALYISGAIAGTNIPKLYKWDGSAATATAKITLASPYTSLKSMGVYRNKIYLDASRNDATSSVIEFDPITEQYSTSLTIAVNIAIVDDSDFAVFNDRLYWITGGATDNIYRFDGSTWETLSPIAVETPTALGMRWHAAATAGDRLYIAGGKISNGQIHVISTDDGVIWHIEYAPGEGIGGNGSSLVFSQGQLFMGTGDGILHAIALTESQYKVAGYQLSDFRAPNRERNDPKRHRYFFSYDRENGINIADDAMLVGIGVVPQYLSLAGDEAD